MSEIEMLRNEIAKIDAEIVALVGKRLDISKEIGKIKRNLGLAVIVPDVEETVKKRYVEEARKANISKEMAEKLAEFLIATSRSVQK